MSEKQPDERRENRDQKNLRMGEFYRKELLPELAKLRYGSEEKQGQVVEDALDLFVDDEGDGEDIVSMIEDIHAVVAGGRGAHTQTSGVESESDEEDSILSELERKAAEGESIDPEEYDLSVIKGKPVDRPAIVARAVLTGTHTALDKNSIQEFCQREVGYSINAARDLAKEAMWELEDELHDPVPSKDWVREQVEEDLRNDRHNTRKGGEGMTESKYRREFGKSVEAYTDARDDLPADGPYAEPERSRRRCL